MTYALRTTTNHGLPQGNCRHVATTPGPMYTLRARCAQAEISRRSAGDLLRRGGVGEEEGGDAEDGEDEGGVLGLAVLGRLVHGAHLLPVDPASEAMLE